MQIVKVVGKSKIKLARNLTKLIIR